MSPSSSPPAPFLLPEGCLILAPMVALSHRALRELILELGGMDLAYTEMASAGAAVSGSPYEDCYFDPGPQPSKVVFQLFTGKPERLPEALEWLSKPPDDKPAEAPSPGESPSSEAGQAAKAGKAQNSSSYRGAPVFGADINFGCAAPHITKAGGGAAWMRKPEEAFALARSARKAWNKHLSAKIRLGLEDDYQRLADFVRGLAEAGVQYVTVHPRLEAQKFRRQGKWEYIARLAEEMPIPIIGNGDVRSYSDYAKRMAEARPRGVMLGREAVRRPWIFSLIKGKKEDSAFELKVDLLDIGLRMLDLIEARLIPEFRLTRAQRFFFYYSDNVTFAHYLKWKLVNSQDLESMRGQLRDYFAERPEDRIRIYSD